ncbi:tyrosine-type recombinase/integrase [Nonomuraea sp. NPDC004702]
MLAFQAGLPPVRLHDLRHGAASIMLAAGVDLKVVQETLGHVSSTFTRDTYTSVYPEVARAAAESTAALINTAAAGAHSARLITLPNHTGHSTTRTTGRSRPADFSAGLLFYSALCGICSRSIPWPILQAHRDDRLREAADLLSAGWKCLSNPTGRLGAGLAPATGHR